MLDLSEDETRMETVIKKCDRIFGLPCVDDYDQPYENPKTQLENLPKSWFLEKKPGGRASLLPC